MNNKPLSVILEEARQKFAVAINRAIEETKLPAYLCEGFLLEALAELRAQKCSEILADINKSESMGGEDDDNNSEDNA